MSATPVPTLVWTPEAPDRGWLRRMGYAVLAYSNLCSAFVAPARAVGLKRTSLASPVQPLLDRYARHAGVAVLDAQLDTLEDLQTLYGFVLEPAHRAGCRLVVHAPRTLDELDPRAFVDADFAYPWTLERARALAARMTAATTAPAHPGPPQPSRPLDQEQLRAVGAHDGVVQVIAPAGSGKTTVLVERVRELLRRGARPDRILCTTFNAAAAKELRERLERAGVTSVEARTFHSVGLGIVNAERLTRGTTRRFTVGQWRWLCAQARRETGEWVDAPDAREAISHIKLGELLTAGEWRAVAPPDVEAQTIARIYELYEAEQRRAGAIDFDDQIMLAVRTLRSHADIRGRWQARFDRVLVDEYQDIEPAQELLVQILAAPQDSLLCVGDEDQVLYGWRRASAERIVALDQSYPGLQRIALQTNYRCPPAVVQRSAQLVAHNTIRFPKEIGSAPGRPDEPGAVSLDEHPQYPAAARWSAEELAGRRRGEIVVLARTTSLLRIVALACARRDVRISAPDRVFEAQGALAAIEAHLRLAANPTQADPEDIVTVMRHPGRGLPPDAETTVAHRLRTGATWAQALADLSARHDRRLAEAATLLDLLRGITDAQQFIRTLRTVGGLDEHFAEYERDGAEQTDTDDLADAERDAHGHTVAEVAALLQRQHDELLAIRDEEHGVELQTVHGAKGREWPTVIVFGFDDEKLPHKKALQVSPALAARGEGLEAERRVAYVALTRAKQRLHVLVTVDRASDFALEAGLTDKPRPDEPQGPGNSRLPSHQRRSLPVPQTFDPTASMPAARRSSPPAPATPRPTGPPGSERIQQLGLARAIGSMPDRPAAMRLAAWAIDRHANQAGRTRTRDLLLEIPGLQADEADDILATTDVRPDELVRRLSPYPRERLATELAKRAGRRG